MLYIQALAIISGILLVAGDWLYCYNSIKGRIQPNPLSWMMFTYGTAVLFLLELDQGAAWVELVLPGACTLSGITIVLVALFGPGKHEPLDFVDGLVLGIDLVVTGLYAIGWVFMLKSLITEVQRETISYGLLVCWNAGVVTSFIPIIRGVITDSSKELSGSWWLWSGSFTALFVTTTLEGGSFALFLYPALNIVACLSVALLSLAPKRVIASGTHET